MSLPLDFYEVAIMPIRQDVFIDVTPQFAGGAGVVFLDVTPQPVLGDLRDAFRFGFRRLDRRFALFNALDRLASFVAGFVNLQLSSCAEGRPNLFAVAVARDDRKDDRALQWDPQVKPPLFGIGLDITLGPTHLAGDLLVGKSATTRA